MLRLKLVDVVDLELLRPNVFCERVMIVRSPREYELYSSNEFVAVERVVRRCSASFKASEVDDERAWPED